MENMEITLEPLGPDQREEFIRMNQRSFQKAADEEFGANSGVAIPREDILRSIDSPTAETYAVIRDDIMIGGVCINNNPKSVKTSLDLLFLDIPYQGSGIGSKVWNIIESKYPDTRIWETHTPYFEKRNIHFYVNKCGFHIVEFYCPQNPEPDGPDDVPGGEYFFRFEKRKF